MHVRPASSYHESLSALNERLKKAGKAPVKIILLPDALEDEDMLEMLNAGLLEFIVVDDWKAKMWAQVLPKIKVREDLVLRAEGHTGWAIRKDSPKLAAVAERFPRELREEAGRRRGPQAQYHKRVKQITNNTGQRGAEALRARRSSCSSNTAQSTDFDPLMLAAQGYQESQLRQEARSHVGAIGVMQIMPATGKELRVGNIHEIEPNIHGGAKYMDQLMTRYFPDAKFSERTARCSPSRATTPARATSRRCARRQRKRGLDPDKWFNNVELVVAEKIGMETTTYVRNIYKYYIAYKLATDAQDAARQEREKLERKP